MATGISTEELRKLLNRCDQESIRHFQGATSLCASRSHFDILPDHLLFRLMDDTTGDVSRILRTFNVNRAGVRRAMQSVLDGLPVGHHGKPALSPQLVELFQSASVLADELGFEQIRTGLLLLAIVLNPGHTKLGELSSELDRIDPDQLRDHLHEIIAEAPAEGEAVEPGARRQPGGGPAGSALEQYTVDLTARAAAGEIDPVFGRDQEIRQIIDVLARRRKNNPILVGEPGTGKTAIVEGLALRICQGDVPAIFRGVKLLCLDLGLLQAGAGVKGEFENRLKNVIREIKESETPIITFIDEAHVLIGAGGSAGGGDASNLLKPALARGQLRAVAATTWAEYKKYFEKDAALARRFQLVRCDEPSVENSIVMLRGLKDMYESHHKVVVLDGAIKAAVELSDRYISGRFLPDKAVDLLDTTAARVVVSRGTRPAELEDLDRQLNHLDTAIGAIERDRAAGMTIDDEALAEMRSSREAILTRIAEVESRWESERALVERIRLLREQCGATSAAAEKDVPVDVPGQRAEGGDGDKPCPDHEAGAEKSTAVEGLSPEQARAELSDALQELKRIQGESPLVYPHVDEASVAAVVSDWTGIPAGRMVRDQIQAALRMEDILKQRVVGQDHAIATVAEKLRSRRAGLGNPEQPTGVFLCVGPSGVGKTELALAVADLVFGGDQFLTSINMSEFMESHTVSQLKGSPPGYVGYGEGGVLTEAARQHPYTVILLDEVEKAHPDVMNLFYQVFDKGILADGEGRIVDFSNTVIFLTSNLATDVIQTMCESGEEIDQNDLREAIFPHLRAHFKPALVARMTVIPFFTLSQEVLKSIAEMKLKKVARRLSTAHGITLEAGENLYETMAHKCNQVDLGARQIDHLLERTIVPEMSRRVLEEMAKDRMPTQVRLDVNADGEFTYQFSD